jgi:uncharacterized NAD-dependent epimerase/dehydratase family protein
MGRTSMKRHIVILTEGRSNPQDAKTASGLLRYRGEEVVALLDSTMKGRTAGEVFGWGGSIPFISRLSEGEADTLVIGIAPAGGGLPEAWRPILREAIERGMTIVNGLHFFLQDDAELSALARARGARLHDVRRPPPDLTVSANVAKDLPCFRVHTVGHDCNVGKMLNAIEVTAGLNSLGRRAEFVATGQTGIMVSGWGVPIDRVVSDFVAGAIEKLMVEHQTAEFLLIEGQGSLVHPLYSGVTLGLLHGCAPQAMIMCYEAGRTDVRHANMAMPPLGEVIRIYETMASIIRPSRVIAIASNTSLLAPREAERELKETEDRLGRPATDVVRFGSGKLVEAVLLAEKEMAGPPGRAPSRSGGHTAPVVKPH